MTTAPLLNGIRSLLKFYTHFGLGFLSGCFFAGLMAGLGRLQ